MQRTHVQIVLAGTSATFVMSNIVQVYKYLYHVTHVTVQPACGNCLLDESNSFVTTLFNCDILNIGYFHKKASASKGWFVPGLPVGLRSPFARQSVE